MHRFAYYTMFYILCNVLYIIQRFINYATIAPAIHNMHRSDLILWATFVHSDARGLYLSITTLVSYRYIIMSIATLASVTSYNYSSRRSRAKLSIVVNIMHHYEPRWIVLDLDLSFWISINRFGSRSIVLDLDLSFWIAINRFGSRSIVLDRDQSLCIVRTLFWS